MTKAAIEARALVLSFLHVPDNAMPEDSNKAWIDTLLAKRCALVCVEVLIKEHTFNAPISWNIKQKAYWESVKEEINSL